MLNEKKKNQQQYSVDTQLAPDQHRTIWHWIK